ncbi:MAG: hypothetical protein E7651_03340 [Ruminococcaceae bacterium]|nr:hypothetical protein [Oscillospiraceae bacterium]
MSTWGPGIKQSDEFMDVYDEFFELYKDDAVATDLYQAILTEYQAEFSDEESSPMLYTVYYALAQCLWECGVKDDWLWRKIKDIIDTDADLKFWNQLGLEPQLEKSRRKALLKFWEKINSKPTKIKKPKKTTVKREPTLHKGDLFAYVCENGYRIALVLDFVWDSYLTAISEEILDHVPDETEAMLLYTHTLSWFSARASIPKKDRILITGLKIDGNYNNRAGLLVGGLIGCSSIGEREFFFNLNAANQCMKRNKIGRYQFQELLNPEILPKYHPQVNADLL